jgi:protein-L-isoaspartate(D-aspartate) O-methyltransferase
MHAGSTAEDLDSMIDFAHARRVMVDNQLRTSGVTDRRLLAAMGEVPREKFVPAARQSLAYIDGVHPLSANRQLGAPAPFAKLVQLAEIDHTDRVLDVGCGNGYSAAVLAHLGESVVAVDTDTSLVQHASATLAEIGLGNVTVVAGELSKAGAEHGPYDVIVVEGTVDAVPEALFAQLKPTGRLVALIAAPGQVPVANLFVKSDRGLASSVAFDARLPQLQPAADPGFVF